MSGKIQSKLNKCKKSIANTLFKYIYNLHEEIFCLIVDKLNKVCNFMSVDMK